MEDLLEQRLNLTFDLSALTLGGGDGGGGTMLKSRQDTRERKYLVVTWTFTALGFLSGARL